MLKLTSKRQLTHDVFELTFESAATLDIQAWQFFMFILPSGGRRAYSIAYSDGTRHVFIIKRLENGKGGSKEICDLAIGSETLTMPALGHFILRPEDNSKLFIGTGTGFAPLYFQIRKALESGIRSNLRFIFGVREQRDVFYLDELEQLKKDYANFDFSIYLSREKNIAFQSGYVTGDLDPGGIAGFREFYICGSPALVRDARQKLADLSVPSDHVFFEQY